MAARDGGARPPGNSLGNRDKATLLHPYTDLRAHERAEPLVIDEEFTNANGRMRCTVGEFPGSTADVLEISKMDDVEYPDWHNVMPKGEVVHSVSLSLHVLETLVAIARQASGTRKGESRPMVFEFGSDLDPVKVTDPKDPALTIVAMPCRL